MKTERLERLLKLIRELESASSQTVEEMAELTGVSRRTVFRDLDLLAEAGLRYSYDRDGKRYSSDRAALLPPVTLTHGEAMALMLAARQASKNQTITDANAAASAGIKLESALPAPLRDYVEPLVECVEFRPPPSSDAASIHDTMAMLQAALAKRQKVRLRYDSYYEGRAIDVVVHPYRLAFVNRGWYLIAHTQEESAVRTYKIERILGVRRLDDVYTIDPAFTLENYFGNAWLMIRGDKRFHVKIRFRKKVAANVEEIHWHKTQRTRYEIDGSMIFEVDVDGIEEIAWWILGYGDQAEVLQPPELRELLAERIERMRSIYKKQPAETQRHLV